MHIIKMNVKMNECLSIRQGRSQGYTPYTKYRGPRPWGAPKGIFLGPQKGREKREMEKKKKEKKRGKGGKKRTKEKKIKIKGKQV